MSASTSVTVVLVDDPMRKETIAVAGFLAGYCGSTRRSYATDLRLFSAWCHQANLTLFSVRRAHLKLYGRWMEETGRMRSTVARRLSTLASFYKYCEQEQLVDRNPALNVRRPKVDYEKGSPFETFRRPPATLIPARPCGTTGAGGHWTATPPTSWRRSWPAPPGDRHRRRYRALVTLARAGSRAGCRPTARSGRVPLK